MIRKHFGLLLITALLITPACALATDITVKVDGSPITFSNAQPYVDSNNRVLVVIRPVIEKMGGLATWNQETQQATLTKGSDTVVFTLNNDQYSVNGLNQSMDSAPIVQNDQILIPLRFAAEAFGATATWDGPNMTALITTGSTPPATDAPQPTIYKYPADASQLDGYTLIEFTPGSKGDAVKVKCTNNDTINIRPLRDINNNIIGTTRDDDRWMSYWDLAATALYGIDGTYQVPVGTSLTFDVWIKRRDSNHVSYEALVLDEYRFVVPDHPKN